ncbi:DNA methylase [Halopseudomonas nanhaiensis]|uniref:DNA methylase n=1 Tax=Halopseudomonas nanhaiensis TaxID=2830842 RepID=UPI001CBEB826|nr:DNA methylase [Halopseudomonas nanhaiensis]UAW98824.1 DNA methylase [Halopseudomonas nanhaiensis]
MARQINAADIGLTLRKGDESSLFKWFLASFLFGKRIRQATALRTYRVIVEQHGHDSPDKLCQCSHRQLVNMLGEGGYARYDESTAERLRLMCEKLNGEFGGKVSAIFEQSADREELEKRLRQFKGIGPRTTDIFLRETGEVWT